MAKGKPSARKPKPKPVGDAVEPVEIAEEDPPIDAAPKVLQLPRGKLAMTRDPRIWARSLPPQRIRYCRILGLDLSGSCGASFCDIIPGQPVLAAPIFGGQWNLSVGLYDTNSIRYVRLKEFLYQTGPSLILYEEVKFTGQMPGGGGSLAALVARAISGAQVVHGLAATLVTWAEENSVPCQSVPIGTLKKYATGLGNASKVDMIKACNKHFGTEFVAEGYEHTGVDNIADSMFLCDMGVAHYAEGLRCHQDATPPATTE